MGSIREKKPHQNTITYYAERIPANLHCDTPVHRYYSVMVHKNVRRLLRLLLFLPICIVTDALRAIMRHHGYKENKCDHLGIGSYAVTCVISE